MQKRWRLDQAIEMRLTLHRAPSCIADKQFSQEPPLALKNGSEKGIKGEIKRGFFPSETRVCIQVKLCGPTRSIVCQIFTVNINMYVVKIKYCIELKKKKLSAATLVKLGE